MSKKLTEQKIEEMIAELLQEEQERLNEFKVKITGKWSADKKDIGLTKLSQLGSGLNSTAASQVLADLAALDGGAKDLEDSDFQKASDDRASKPKNWKYVQNIVGTSTDANIKSWKAGGGGSTGAQLASAAGLTKKDNNAPWVAEIKRLLSASGKTDAASLFNEFIKIKYSSKSVAQITSLKKGTGALGVVDKLLNGTGPIPPGSTAILDQALTDIAKIPDYEPQTMTRPVMTTQNVMSKNVGTTAGTHTRGYAGGLNNTFSGLFKGANTARERFKVIDEFSDAMVNDKNFGTQFGTNKTKFLNAVVAMDFISAMVKEMDKGSAPYVFEAFCGMIHGGAGTGGANKAGDFTIWTSSGKLAAGSSKFLKSTGGSQQAVSGFNVGESVMYVQALKKDSSGKGTADPDAISSIDLYIYEVTFTKIHKKWSTGGATNNKATVIDGKGNNMPFSFVKAPGTGKNTYIDFSPTGPDFTIHVASASKIKSLKDSLNATLGTAKDKTQKQAVQDAYNLMNEYFSETYKADTSIKKYLGMSEKQGLSSSTLAMGTNALSAIQAADEKQVALFNELGGGSTVGTLDSGGNRTLEESKLQSLDQLIVETMRDIKRKRKK